MLCIQYYVVPENSSRLTVFAQRLRRRWRLMLCRRSQRSRMRWDRITPTFQQWIPAPGVLHRYPLERFVATHPRWELYA
jgi:RNA-directed DNA polymerase